MLLTSALSSYRIGMLEWRMKSKGNNDDNIKHQCKTQAVICHRIDFRLHTSTEFVISSSICARFFRAAFGRSSTGRNTRINSFSLIIKIYIAVIVEIKRYSVLSKYIELRMDAYLIIISDQLLRKLSFQPLLYCNRNLHTSKKASGET